MKVHGQVAFNIYGEPSGSWLVCSRCDKEEHLAGHMHEYELGWSYNVCPSCLRKEREEKEQAEVEVQSQEYDNLYDTDFSDFDDIPF